MATEQIKRKQFLIVNHDRDFLAKASAALKQLAGNSCSIRTATNHSQALEELKIQQLDALVLDLEMPVMDGIEFLRLLSRSHPGQQAVMLASKVDDGRRQTALDLGASLFLQRPEDEEGFAALYSALDALAGSKPQSGFRGVMQRVGLQDVLQMECLARKSSVLVVSTGNRKGQIHVCDGEIVHAQSGQLQGEMALYGILALTGGEFTLEPYAEPPRRSISGQYQFLLMEAARLRDEAGTQSPLSSGGMGPASDFGTGTAEVTPTEARGIQIEEVLLCSGAGEVLHQWKCEGMESRLELFQKIEQLAMQSSKGTPSGRFHRVSMDTGEGRTVIQIQPTFRLLVRSAMPAQPSPNE